MSATDQGNTNEEESEDKSEDVERPDDAPEGLHLAVDRDSEDDEDKEVAELDD